jgi:hypothetical protein
VNELGISYEPGHGFPWDERISGFQRFPKPKDVDRGLNVEFGFMKSTSELRRVDLKRGSFEKLQPLAVPLRVTKGEFIKNSSIYN